MATNDPDFGEIEAYKASGGTFPKRREKTYEDVELERELEELREQNESNKTQ
jgi:hypothetical protein